MGNFSPAHYDDQLLHKVKGVVLRVLEQLNEVGEIVHARSLAPPTRRSRPVPLSDQHAAQQNLRGGMHVSDTTISNAAGLTQAPDPLARVSVDKVHYSYEQFVTQLDGEDKFLKRLVEILIKETAVQAHQRQVEMQRAEASTSSGSVPSPSRTVSPPISLSRLARSSLIQRPGVTLRDEGPIPRPLSIAVASDDSAATEVPITFHRGGNSERNSRVAAGNLFPGSRRRPRAELAASTSSASSDEEVEVASTRTFQIGDDPAPENRSGVMLPQLDLGARLADALRRRRNGGAGDMEDDMSFTFPPAQPPLASQSTGGANSVPFPGADDGAQAEGGNSDSGLASRLTALRASLNRMRALRTEVAGSRQQQGSSSSNASANSNPSASASPSTTRATSLQRSPAIRLRNSSGNLRRAAAAAAAASAFEDRASTTRMTSLDRGRALGRGMSTISTARAGIPSRNRADSGPAELGQVRSAAISAPSQPAGVRRTDEFAAFAARRRTEARQGQEEHNAARRQEESAAAAEEGGWAPSAPRTTTSLVDASASSAAATASSSTPPSSFGSSVDSRRRDWEMELRTIDEHIASIRGRTAALRQRQDELLRTYDGPGQGVEAGRQTQGFVATVVDEDGNRRIAAEPGDWTAGASSSSSSALPPLVERRIAGQGRVAARGRFEEAGSASVSASAPEASSTGDSDPSALDSSTFDLR